MAFETNTLSSLSDLMSKLDTFLTANGWTVFRSAANGQFGARRTAAGIDIGFAAQWDTTSPNNLGIYHFHGAAYNSANAPWAQNDDSGNGFAGTADASLGGQRHAQITNTPVRYWFFESDYYFHVVVQQDSTDYVHFGAGALTKYGDGGWTGGEYVYGHRQQTGFSSDVAVRVGTSILLDGLCKDGTSPEPSNMEEYAATVHVEGMPNQGASSKYAVVMGGQGSANLGNDRQATPQPRVHFISSFRASLGTLSWGQFHGDVAKGLLPGYPINVGYWDRTTGTDIYAPLGRMPDVRGMSIRDYSAGDEITIGADTWLIFPSFRKYTGTLTNSSAYQGIIYKKVTT